MAYVAEQKIGEGAFGMVYRGRDVMTGERVAMKYMSSHHGISATKLSESARTEFEFLRLLNNCKSIVKLFSVFQYGYQICLIYEFLDYDLERVVMGSPMKFTETQAAVIMKQLLDAVSFCHRMNVIHRDIKLNNILINRNGTVKLADFGLACKYSRNLKEIVTRRELLPPELQFLEACYGAELDVWCVGIVMAEICQKSRLFRREQTPEGRYRQIADLWVVKWYDEPADATSRHDSRQSHARIKRMSIRYWCTKLEMTFRYLSDPALELLMGLLEMKPSRRIRAEEATRSTWFKRVFEAEPFDFTLMKNTNVMY